MATEEPANLSEWYDSHAAALVLYARQIAPDAAAEDIVQDVFVRLLGGHACRLAGGSSRPRNVKAWLYRSVRNAAFSALRSGRRRRMRERRGAQGRPEAFQSRPDDLIDARQAEALLAALPLDQREAVLLRIWSDLTFQEISEVTATPVTTVFRRFGEALAAIRKGMHRSCPSEKT